MISQAFILAGGLGTRLGALTRQTPKPMLPVGGKPFLEYLVWNLRRHGITSIVLSVGHLSPRIITHFKDGSDFGVHIEYVAEETPLGTGGALKRAEDKFHGSFLVLNGDTLFDFNYLDLALRLGNPDILGALSLRSVPDASRYGSVALEQGRIQGFQEKSQTGQGLISGGVYALRKELLQKLSTGPGSIEQDLFPGLATEGLLAGAAYEGFFIDIGLPETLYRAQTDLPAWRRKPAVFFDHRALFQYGAQDPPPPGEFAPASGAAGAVKRCNDEGRLVVAVNGCPSRADSPGAGHFEDSMRQAGARLREQGAHIDAVLPCIQGPGESLADRLRPVPDFSVGHPALERWDIDLDNSVFLGGAAKSLAGRTLGKAWPPMLADHLRSLEYE